ncbi:MAG: alpha/beta hydrolase, partial [Rhodospirillales bacterium]|nr:alpha/beta hydrolase [Acetobacter sp.]
AIISQNGNAYEEGLGDAWAPIRAYWEQPTPEHRDALRPFLTLEATRGQYVTGAPDPQAVAPESYWLDAALMQRPGNAEIQLDLFLDYRTNVALYPKFQEFFRTFKPPTLAIWGKHDPFFTPPGAEAFLKDNPDATVRFLNAGHFALETNLDDIAAAVRELLAKVEA